MRRRAPSLIDVDLAPEQRRVVDHDARRSVLVLGEAGHGKTTVALHRLARLFAERASDDLRAAVIVPTPGLVRLLQPLVVKLGVDVDVVTFDAWARRQARRVFRDLPKKESEDATAGVLALKRDPALRVALRALAKEAPGLVDDDREKRLVRTRAHARRGDLQHLFGDRLLLQAVQRASAGLSDYALEETLEHTRVQFSKTAETEHAHVTDKKRLRAVDGRPMDAGTASGDARSVDTEDYPVLFELDRLRAEHLGVPASSPPLFDLLLVDEAQELAPLELALIGRSLAPDGVLIVAGDAAQQIDPSVTFQSWAASVAELGQDAARMDTFTLEMSHRCPPSVVALARATLGTEARAVPDPKPPLVEVANDLEVAALTSLVVDPIHEADPKASVVVLTRSQPRARELVAELVALTPARYVPDGRFFSRGTQVTSIDQVKGLEFDYVIVADASLASYPEAAESRRLLYVAMTRARVGLAFVSPGPPSTIVTTALAR
jgi:DNA helicase IV